MKKIKEIFTKIKKYFHYYIFNSYLYKHDKFVDEKLDYLMNNFKSLHMDEDNYFIVIETINNECFALWNCNYPYGWLSIMTCFNKNYDDYKDNFYDYFDKEAIVYTEKLPSIKKIIEFKEWLQQKTNNKWEPLLDDNN